MHTMETCIMLFIVGMANGLDSFLIYTRSNLHLY